MANFGFRRKDQAATDFINANLEQAHQQRSEYEEQWYENWGNYRVEDRSMADGRPSKAYPLAGNASIMAGGLSPINFLKTAESHQGVNTLRALLLSGLFGTRDYVQADPVGDEDVESAKRVSRLVMFGLERPGNFRTNFELTGDALIFGLGSYSARWKEITRLVPRRMPVPDPMNPGDFLRDPQTGNILSVLQNMEVPIAEDPAIETDDMFDTWFDPSANRFGQLKWKAMRFRIRDEELDALKDSPSWDREGIQRVLMEPPTDRTQGPERSGRPKLLTENLTEEDLKDIEDFGYYGGFVYEGAVPKEIADEIGVDHRSTSILRIINGTVVQATQSPQKDGNIQGGTMTILPTGRGIYGLSPLTVVRYLQDVSDTQLVLTTQALIESVYQNFIISGDLGPQFARRLETRRPREVFEIQGEMDQIMPLPKDYSGLQISMAALGMFSQAIRNAMNARDPIQGLQQQGGTTATEAQLTASAALQNTDQLAILIERDELPIMGRLINDLYYINLPDEGAVFRRVGETETTSVNYFDIDAVTDINFVGARSLLSKQGIANQFRDFAQILLSNPLTAASTDWHELVRRWGDEGFQVKGLERLMIIDPEEIVARMQSMGLANTVGPSQGAGGGAPPSKARSNTGNSAKKGANSPAQAAGQAS